MVIWEGNAYKRPLTPKTQQDTQRLKPVSLQIFKSSLMMFYR